VISVENQKEISPLNSVRGEHRRQETVIFSCENLLLKQIQPNTPRILCYQVW